MSNFTPIPLHQEIQKVLNSKPALIFSFDALKGFLLNNFKLSQSLLLGVSVPMEGTPDVSVKFTKLSVDPSSFVLNLKDISGNIYISIETTFVAEIVVHDSASTAREFSTISLSVSDLKARLYVTAPNLILGPPDFQVAGSLVDDKNRTQAIIDSGIPEDHILRIEGAVQSVDTRRYVLALFGSLNKLNLSEMFSAFELRGLWESKIISNALAIIPSLGISIKEQNGCPEKDILPELEVKLQNVVPGGKDGEYSWPSSVIGIPNLKVGKANNFSEGFASVYLPKPVLDARFSKVMPSITYAEAGDGFIGYDLTLLVAFKYIGLTLDPARVGLILDLEFLSSGFVNATIDVPCVGRSDLANARFNTQPSTLKIFIGLAENNGSRLSLQGQLESLNLGTVDVTIFAISKWAGLAGGKAAVIGFILDYILKRVAEHVLPIKMKKGIKDAVNGFNFPLLELESLLSYARFKTFNEVNYSATPDSLLLGLNSNG